MNLINYDKQAIFDSISQVMNRVTVQIVLLKKLFKEIYEQQIVLENRNVKILVC